MTRAGRAWGAYFALGGAAVVAHFGLGLRPLAQNVVYDAIGLSAVVAIVVGIHLQRPQAARAWYLIAVGQLLFVAGDVLWAVFEFGLHTEPFPSAADVLYLSGYPVLAAGVLRLVRVHLRGGDRGALIDGSIIAIGAGLLAWVFLIGPYVDDHTLSGLELAISVAYPLGDILILGVGVGLAVGPTIRAPVFGLLMASLVGLLASDIVYAVQVLGSGYETGAVDAGWLLSYVLLGVAALHPSVRALSQPAAGPKGSRRPPLGVLAAAALLAPIALLLQTQRGVEAEDVLVIASGSAVIFLLVVSRLGGLVREVDAKVGALNRQGSELRSTLDDLRRLEEERKLLLERVLLASEEERIRIAADLHDGPIQQLAKVGFGLERARLRLERGDTGEVLTLLDRTQGELSEEMDGLRGMMASLRPPALDEYGLEGALRDQVSSFRDRFGTDCSLAAALPRRLDSEIETSLYRVAQEALTNVSKHAHASRVWVDLWERNGWVELAVKDNGSGFDATAWPSGASRGHFGLLAMREQVRMAGGRFEVKSRPGWGTLVRVAFPRERD
jgi:signal transduction histidine kinase